MKKNHLYIFLGCIAVGITCILYDAFGPNFGTSSVLWGIGGGLIGSGVAQAYKYYYWTRPKNTPVYEQRLAEQQINLHDERKTMIREKAGRQAFIYSFYAQIALYVVLTITKLMSPTASLIFMAFWFIQLFGSRWLQKQMEQEL